MKSKLIFRVLGALSSSLIIASVFIPFISVTGYSQSLWQAHNSVGTLYLPIMIIVFGVIGVLVFSTNIKTELAYATTGALIFFLITQTIPIINGGTFNTLSVGYYCLVIGTIINGLMAFLTNLRTKRKVEEVKEIEETKEVSMIDQIDKLYNDQAVQNPTNESNDLNNIIQPLPIQDVISPIPSQSENSVENNIEPISAPNLPIVDDSSLPELEISDNGLENVQPVINENNNIIDSINVNNTELSAPTEQQNISSTEIEHSIEQSNPVIAEFSEPDIAEQTKTMEQNPTVLEFSTQQVPVSNPVTSEFAESTVTVQAESVKQNPTILEFNSQPKATNNPVVSEFNVPNNFSFMEQSVDTTQSSVMPEVQEVSVESLQPLNSENKIDIMGEPKKNNSDLDIFG